MLRPNADPHHPFLPREYDTGFTAFMRAFGGWWLTAMSGPLSVPIAIFGLLWTTGWLRIAFCTVAFLCWILSSWYVWRQEREAKNAKQGELLEEKAKNAKPEITGEIQEIHFQSTANISAFPVRTDLYATIKIYLVNERPKQTTIKRYELTVKTDKGVFRATEAFLDDDLQLKREERRQGILGMPISNVTPVSEKLESLDTQRRIPMTEGVGREGWLRFVFPDVSGEPSTEEIEGGEITLNVIDAFGIAHPITAKPPHLKTGELVSGEMEEINRIAVDDKKESSKEQTGALKPQLEEQETHKLIIEVDTSLESQVLLFHETDNIYPNGIERGRYDHYIVNTYLRLRFVNNDVHPTTVRKVNVSLVREVGGRRNEIPLRTSYPPNIEKGTGQGIQRVNIDDGIPIAASELTTYFKLNQILELRTEDAEKLDADCFLRVTTLSQRQSPYTIDLKADWAAARRHLGTWHFLSLPETASELQSKLESLSKETPNLVFKHAQISFVHVDDNGAMQEGGGVDNTLKAIVATFQNKAEPPRRVTRAESVIAHLTYYDVSGEPYGWSINKGAWEAEEYNHIDIEVGDTARLVIAARHPRGFIYGYQNNNDSPERRGQVSVIPLKKKRFIVEVELVVRGQSEAGRKFKFKLTLEPEFNLELIES